MKGHPYSPKDHVDVKFMELNTSDHKFTIEKTIYSFTWQMLSLSLLSNTYIELHVHDVALHMLLVDSTSTPVGM